MPNDKLSCRAESDSLILKLQVEAAGADPYADSSSVMLGRHEILISTDTWSLYPQLLAFVSEILPKAAQTHALHGHLKNFPNPSGLKI